MMRTNFHLVFVAFILTVSGCEKPTAPTFLEKSKQYQLLVEQMKNASGAEYENIEKKAEAAFYEYMSARENYKFCAESTTNFDRSKAIVDNIKLRRSVNELPDDRALLGALPDLYERASTTVPKKYQGLSCPDNMFSIEGEKAAAVAEMTASEYMQETKMLIAERYAKVAPKFDGYQATITRQLEVRSQRRERESWNYKSQAERLSYVNGDRAILACMNSALSDTTLTHGIPNVIGDTLTLCRMGLKR